MAGTAEKVAYLQPGGPLRERIDQLIRRLGRGQETAIPVLQEIQKEFGYIPPELLPRVAALTGLCGSELYSIATFYSQFRLHPIGENLIQVCHGTACHLAGAEEITAALRRELGIEEGDTSPDQKYTIEKVACLGCCSLAPVITINGETFGRLTPEKAVRLVRGGAGQKKKETQNKKGVEDKAGPQNNVSPQNKEGRLS
ncbi:MAG: NADH-quinone oxidoreductase subunit NuoE [Firmicutes bacterium]|nr:NADH-quinone oxidoreductase subunit NuoE [Bacillota bacterium]